MIGVSEELLRDLQQRFTAVEIAQFFSGRANRGQILLTYARQNGDRTSALPSSRHMSYVSRGWTAVAIAADPFLRETKAENVLQVESRQQTRAKK